MKLAIIVVAIAIFITLTLFAIHTERRNFNNGICPKCGEKLICFDVDSQGGRGYKCNKCHYVTWVSYKTVDKNYNKGRER